MTYYSKNKEYINARSIEYYYSHREEILTRIATHRERTNAYNKWYYYNVLRAGIVSAPKHIDLPKPDPKPKAKLGRPRKQQAEAPNIPAVEKQAISLKKIKEEPKKVEAFKDFKTTPKGTFMLSW